MMSVIKEKVINWAFASSYTHFLLNNLSTQLDYWMEIMVFVCVCVRAHTAINRQIAIVE